MLLQTQQIDIAAILPLGAVILSCLFIIMAVGIHSFNVDKFFNASVVVFISCIALPVCTVLAAIIVHNISRDNFEFLPFLVVVGGMAVLLAMYLIPILLVYGFRKWASAN